MNTPNVCSRFTRPIALASALLVITTASVQVDAFRPSPIASIFPSFPSNAQRTHQRTMLLASNTDEQAGDEVSERRNTDDEDKFDVQTINPLRLAVLRLGFTEPAWTSPLNYGKKDGIFSCAYCGKELFDSNSKYDSGSGWPSFWRSIEEGSISYKMEFDGRLECRCGRCTSHLGHVFLDGPKEADVSQDLLEASPSSDPRGQRPNGRLPRFCVNGASLTLSERG